MVDHENPGDVAANQVTRINRVIFKNERERIREKKLGQLFRAEFADENRSVCDWYNKRMQPKYFRSFLTPLFG